MSLLSRNIKFLRKQKGLTQAEMHSQTGISNATWSNYELGNTEPNVDLLIIIAKFFGVTVDELIKENFEEGNLISKNKDQKKQQKGNLKGNVTGNLIDKKYQIEDRLSIVNDPGESLVRMPKVITVDSQGNENVIMVPVKARAGYLNGYGDQEFISTLPAYRIPGLNNGSYRIFEVEGISMYPTLNSGDLAIGKSIENLQDIRDDRVHIIVTLSDGIVIKRVLNRLNTDGKLILKSDNYKERDMFPPIVCDPANILEVWYATGYISRQMRPPAEVYNRVVDLEGRLTILESIVKKSTQ